MAVLAEKFGVQSRQVIVLHDETKLSVYELAPIYSGAHYFKRSPNTIWELRQQGLSWKQISARVHMSPSAYTRLAKKGAFDRDRFWETSYSDRFGVSHSDVAVMRRDGGSLEDVLASIIVGRQLKRQPHDIFTQYKANGSWATVTSSNQVRFEDWRRVSKPVRGRLTLQANPVKLKAKSGAPLRTAKQNRGKAVGKAKTFGKAKVKASERNRTDKGGAKVGEGPGKSSISIDRGSW